MFDEGLNKPTETTFDKIYRLAIEKNEVELNKMLAEGVCLGEFQGLDSPVMLLAKNGYHDAVEFLIDRYNANLHDAVKGYGICGNGPKINELIERGASRTIAFEGLAMGGFTKIVDVMISEGESLETAIKCFAMGGRQDLVDKYIKQNKSNPLLHREAMLGFARAGNIELFNFYKAQIALRNEAYPISEFAKNGDKYNVDKLLAVGGIVKGDPLASAIQAYAMCGHVSLVNELIGRVTDPELKLECQLDAVLGYAIGGFEDLVNAQIDLVQDKEKYKLHERALYGYAYGKNIDMVNREFKKTYTTYKTGDNEEELKNSLKKQVLKGYNDGHHLKRLDVYPIAFLIMMTTSPFLKDAIKARAKEIYNKEDYKRIEVEIMKLNNIMQKYQLNVQQAKILRNDNAVNVITLIGPLLLKNKLFDKNILMELLSKTFNISTKLFTQVYDAVHIQHFKSMTRDLGLSLRSNSLLSTAEQMFKAKHVFITESKRYTKRGNEMSTFVAQREKDKAKLIKAIDAHLIKIQVKGRNNDDTKKVANTDYRAQYNVLSKALECLQNKTTLEELNKTIKAIPNYNDASWKETKFYIDHVIFSTLEQLSYASRAPMALPSIGVDKKQPWKDEKKNIIDDYPNREPHGMKRK